MSIKVTVLLIVIGTFTELITGKCPQTSGKKVGTVTSPSINEASGLVASQTHYLDAVLWTLNDSGGPPCIYALIKSGARILTLCLSHAKNYDWEAISTAPCDKK